MFADSLTFSGDGLTRLHYGPPQIIDGFLATLPDAQEASFTKNYTDEATHNTATCGNVALTDVTMSVLQVPYISVRSQDERFFNADLSQGLRRLAADPAAEIDLKGLLRITA